MPHAERIISYEVGCAVVYDMIAMGAVVAGIVAYLLVRRYQDR